MSDRLNRYMGRESQMAQRTQMRNLRNEANALDAPVQSSEFKVQSRAKNAKRSQT